MFVTTAHAQTTAPAPAATTLAPAGEPAAVHTETGHAEAGHGAFPPFNPEYFPSQILWLAITFTIFYLVLKRTILPRIGDILENRRDRIALDLQAAEGMKREADEAQAAYEQELAEARDRSHKIAQEARDAARADAEAERSKTEASLDASLEAAQARIAEIKRETLADVGQIAEDAAEVILADVLKIDVARDEIAGAIRAVRA